MIILNTGVPGSGKTLSVVSDLAKKRENEYRDRKVFVHGIRDLKIRHDPIPDGHSIEDLDVWLKYPENHGAVVVIDECQTVFPVRSSSSKTPDRVAFMNVHRHYGIDFYLITQKPKMIDIQVRELIEAHYHIQKNLLGFRVKYYFQGCYVNPQNSLKHAKPMKFKLDKSAFDLYKSAEVHTKIQTPKSRLTWILPICMILAFLFLFVSYKKVSSLGAAPEAAESPTSAVSSAVQNGVSTQANNLAESSAQKILGDRDRSLKPEMYQPTVEGRAESKPLYDSVRRVQQFEYPVACISGGVSGCTCYSSQGTAIKEIKKKTCADYVQNGLPFNPYKEREREHSDDRPVYGGNSGSEVLVMGGHDKLTFQPDLSAEPSAQ